MSRLIRDAIRATTAGAVAFLEARDELAVPPRAAGVSDGQRLDELQFQLDNLTNALEAATEYYDDLKRLYQDWMSLRNKMGIVEREADDPLLDRFRQDIPFIATTQALRQHIQALKGNRTALQGEIRILTQALQGDQQQQQGTGGGGAAAGAAAPVFHVNLPRLDLPTFGGGIIEWNKFWSTFEMAVHNENSIPATLKLTYLRLQLRDEALRCVEGLPPNAASYPIALTRLREQYGRDDELRRALYSHLRKIPKVSPHPPSRYVEELHKFVDDVESTCYQLANIAEDLNQMHIQVEIESKLPTSLLKDIFRSKESLPAGTVWTTDMLRDKLRQTLRREEEVRRVQEQSRPDKSDPKPSPRNPKQGDGQGGAERPTATFTTNAGSKARRGGSPKLTCIFCDHTGHYTTYCPTVTDIAERTRILRQKKRCYKCLSSEHFSSACPRGSTCRKCGKDSHHLAICAQLKLGRRDSNSPSNSSSNASRRQRQNSASGSRNKSKERSTPTERSPNPAAANSNYTSSSSSPPVESVSSINAFPQAALTVSTARSTVLLKCVNGAVFNPHNPLELVMDALIMFDDCSTTSYISEEFRQRLKIPRGTADRISVYSFGNPTPAIVDSEIVELGFCLPGGKKLVIPVNTTPFVAANCPHSLVTEKNSRGLDNGDYPRVQWGRPDILIGSAHYYCFMPTFQRYLPSGFALIHSHLGRMICGEGKAAPNTKGRPISTSLAITLNAIHCRPEVENLPLPQTEFGDFFGLESIGISDTPGIDVNEEVLKNFHDSITFDGERYEVRLPWRNPNPELPSNFGLALGRLHSTLKNLRATPELLTKYDATIRQQLECGVVEEVPENGPPAFPLHYLPHQLVVRADKGKIRVVYDASARLSKSAPSLNDTLHPGPVLLADLVGVLIRFRLPPVVICADLEKAFLQIGISQRDRDALRFIWVRDLDKPPAGSNLVFFRFTRLPFGLSPSPFLLAATVAHHLRQSKNEIAPEILREIYVDNVTIMAENETEAHKKAVEAKNIFRAGGWRLYEFVSNRPGAIELFADADRLKGPLQKVLGIPWNTASDSLEFIFTAFDVSGPITKRSILSYIASHYDPLGLLSPISLTLKLVFQRLWRDGAGKWDEEVTEEDAKLWKDAIKEHPAHKFVIPRLVYNGPRTAPLRHDLHAFCDASDRAFATALYLVVSSDECAQSSLIFSKSKVKPKKNSERLDIHRMELLAATIGVKAISFIRSHLPSPPERTFLWSDSGTVLYWLCDSEKHEVFVRNRLSVIKRTPAVKIRHVPGEQNPSDVASRGCLPSALDCNSTWWRGPEWLIRPDEDWPRHPEIPSFDTADPPPAKEGGFISLSTSNEKACLIDATRFSRWSKLVRCTAYALRFVKNALPLGSPLKAKFPSAKSSTHSVLIPELNKTATPNDISIGERRFAQIFLLKQAQKRHPAADKENTDLRLFVGPEGLVRSEGRLYRSALPYDAKNPIYLPSHSWISKLFILETHEVLLHGGPIITLAHLRRKFWVPRGRRTVSHVISSLCMVCRRYNARPFARPDPPPLPERRVVAASPFEHSAVDLFGPMWLKSGGGVSKCWGVLFTCMQVRALHLELVTSLSAAEFLAAFRRFISRRGTPKSVTSDNGTNFKLASRAIEAHWRDAWQVILHSDELAEFATAKAINWIFIRERSSWSGGFYERLIAMVKHHLRRALGRTQYTYEQLLTLLCEIEAILNSRPIGFLSTNPNDASPIRPQDFLLPFHDKDPIAPPFAEEEDEYNPAPSTCDNLIALWKSGARKLDVFWKGWTEDYILALRERQKASAGGMKVQRAPAIGELVLMREETLPRGLWKTARVANLLRSDDGETRTAVLQIPSGRLLSRPLEYIFPLESGPPENPPNIERKAREENNGRGGDDRQHSAGYRDNVLCAPTPPPSPSYPTSLIRAYRSDDRDSGDETIRDETKALPGPEPRYNLRPRPRPHSRV